MFPPGTATGTAKGYATGFGTLTWYTQQRGESALYAVYYGNMVHGKFEGPVNLHVKGKTGHAFFTEGTRTSRWARGPASNWKGPQKSPESVAKTSAANASRAPARNSEIVSEHGAHVRKQQRAERTTFKNRSDAGAATVAEKRDEGVQRDATAEKLEPPAESGSSGESRRFCAGAGWSAINVACEPDT